MPFSARTANFSGLQITHTFKRPCNDPPPDDNFRQRVSWAAFLSRLSGGAPERYVPVGHVRPVDDWPSVNLMVRKKDFLSIGGFDSPYWPGEDTKLCLDLIQKTGKKILYVPKMRVWHHRRAGLLAHLRQVGGYGLHRGYFAKRYPATSRKLPYFLPSTFALYVIATVVGLLFQTGMVWFFVIGWVAYFLVLVLAWCDIRKYVSRSVSLTALSYVIPTHFWYGLRFIQGLLTINLNSRLR